MNDKEMQFSPIETKYNGYRFRSRLEARWAVAFDAMGIEYEYEPQGYHLPNGTLYLPDFKLTNVRCRCYDGCSPIYVEVKGQMTPDDERKIEAFPYPLIIAGKIPSPDSINGIINCDLEWYEWNFVYVDGDEYTGVFSKHNGEIWFCGSDHDEWDLGELMKVGCEAGRSARFEWGEEGR